MIASEGPFLAEGGELRPLALTGERTLPDIPEENYWFQRHLAAYRFALGLVEGRRVLDAGCGEGYGSSVLAERAASVTGADLDEATVAHARGRYPGIRFDRADLTSLPYPGGSFDVVVSLQVIEHVAEPRAFVAECARVLAPGGMLVVSTPNRLTFSRDGIRNPFHIYEFAPDELRAVLATALRVDRLAGMFHAARLRAYERALRRPFQERLLEQPAPEWPHWLRRAVVRTRERDFRIADRDVDRSLDLIAIAKR